MRFSSRQPETAAKDQLFSDTQLVPWNKMPLLVAEQALLVAEQALLAAEQA